MRLIIGAIVFILLSMGASVADEKSPAFIAQSILTEIGYDPGPIDGAWGKNSQRALNEFRETKGLKPQSKLTGSSLYILHQASPEKYSVPNPGELLPGFSQRPDFLRANYFISNRHCGSRLGIKKLRQDAKPVISFTEGRSPKEL